MNAVFLPEHCALNPADIVDFKWLMAGLGHHVHAQRLQTDRAYASDCLALAAASRLDPLRRTARRLACGLGVALPAA
jgi:hypothetical protein